MMSFIGKASAKVGKWVDKWETSMDQREKAKESKILEKTRDLEARAKKDRAYLDQIKRQGKARKTIDKARRARQESSFFGKLAQGIEKTGDMIGGPPDRKQLRGHKRGHRAQMNDEELFFGRSSTKKRGYDDLFGDDLFD